MYFQAEFIFILNYNQQTKFNLILEYPAIDALPLVYKIYKLIMPQKKVYTNVHGRKEEKIWNFLQLKDKLNYITL